ncbi:MAG: hypothetical protein LBQ08_02280 [Holosporaceae bacterium]|jgi:opacity protein-like surface antigen|nr:hypothetical protein [Holosporaceae bacterium]
MKKMIIGSLVVSAFCVCANEEPTNETHVYGGVSLEGISSSSEYKMDFEVNQNNIAGGGGVVAHKRTGIIRPGYGIFLGLGGGDDYYFALETGVVFHHFKLRKWFNGYEALEVARNHRTADINTSLICDYGHEYSISLKLGKILDSVKKTRVYGILGTAVREVSVQYDYYYPVLHNINVTYPHGYNKRIWALVPGVGIESELSKNCSWGVEYKYKFYQSADITRDYVNAIVRNGGNRGDADIRPRNYKVKTRQHNLSFRIVFNI